MLYLCITPERENKTGRIMAALAAGWVGETQFVYGAPPDDRHPFVVWGQRWLTEQIVPAAIRSLRPFWYIDNGYWRPAGGHMSGYYRITYRGLAPITLIGAPPAREPTDQQAFKPWRSQGAHILLAYPGPFYGAAIGLNMAAWSGRALPRVRRFTDRPIIERSKGCRRTLREDLDGCWALVTHSSNVAVDAVIAGIPVFVAPSSPAAPVGNLSFAALERPIMPDRSAWWASLMAQQFTMTEMADGTAFRLMEMVREQGDGVHV